ncbi:MAG: hypothetical protein J6J39_03940 [Clostridia bacterium]|nr:hypothetical protein [Clostridia bacterium]
MDENNTKTNVEDTDAQTPTKEVQLNFFEKIKAKLEKLKDWFEKITEPLYKLRSICCFTSLFAIFGVLFLFAERINLPQPVEYVIIFFWLIGVISPLIACPFQMIARFFGFIIGGAVVGFPFLVVGAVVGLVIGGIISLGMVLFLPALVTIPYYNKTLKPNHLARKNLNNCTEQMCIEN